MPDHEEAKVPDPKHAVIVVGGKPLRYGVAKKILEVAELDGVEALLGLIEALRLEAVDKVIEEGVDERTADFYRGRLAVAAEVIGYVKTAIPRACKLYEDEVAAAATDRGDEIPY